MIIQPLKDMQTTFITFFNNSVLIVDILPIIFSALTVYILLHLISLTVGKGVVTSLFLISMEKMVFRSVEVIGQIKMS